MIDMWRTFSALWSVLWPVLSPAVLFLAGVLLITALVQLGDRPLHRRTDKAKENFADGLMSVSHTMISAVMIGAFVFPLAAYLQAFIRGTDPVAALQTWRGSASLTLGHAMAFVLSFLGPIWVAHVFRRRALSLYDEIARKSWP
jgi:hypothetical protein